MVIHNNSQAILRPASPTFIAASLALAFAFNLVTWPREWPMPDLLALVLVFWNIRQPRRVGIGLSWVFGLLMDVHRAGVLGEIALAYTLMSYLAISIHRRVLWFSVWGQAAHVLILFFMAQVVGAGLRSLMGGAIPHPSFLLAPVFTALLWPLATAILMAPQRRPLDPDENRPL